MALAGCIGGHIEQRCFNCRCCSLRFFHREKMAAIEHVDAALGDFLGQRHADLFDLK